MCFADRRPSSVSLLALAAGRGERGYPGVGLDLPDVFSRQSALVAFATGERHKQAPATRTHASLENPDVNLSLDRRAAPPSIDERIVPTRDTSIIPKKN